MTNNFAVWLHKVSTKQEKLGAASHADIIYFSDDDGRPKKRKSTKHRRSSPVAALNC